MKKLMMGMCLLTAGYCGASAQTASPEPNYLVKDFHPFKNFHPVCHYAVMDGGYSQGFLNAQMMRGGHFFVGAFLGKCWTTGFWMDVQETRHYRLNIPDVVEKPDYSFTTFAWGNEINIFPMRAVNFAIPLRAGLGVASYNDRAYVHGYYNGQTYVEEPKNITRGAYFMAETGLNAYVNLFKFMSIGGGATYRYVAGDHATGNSESLSGMMVRGTVRFRITDME